MTAGSDTGRGDSVMDLFDGEDTLDGAAPPPSDPAGPGGDGPGGSGAGDEDARRRRRKLLALLLALVMLVAGAVIAWYLTTRKPISQLPGVTIAQMPTYKTSFYGLDKPLGVTVAPDGSRVFVSQSGANPGVVMFDREGRKLKDLAFPVEDGYHQPVYLATGPDGTVYVGDRTAAAVYLFNSEGDFLNRFVPQDSSIVFSPLGVAVGRDGTLYIADALDEPDAHRILVFSPDGALLKTLGLGQLNFPNQMQVDAAGNVYVTDSNNARFVVFKAEDDQLVSLMSSGAGAGNLGLPRGFAIDDRGRLFIVETNDHVVKLYTMAAELTEPPIYQDAIGDMGVEDGQFLYPNGLAVDARARIYVTDRENNRLQIWGF